MLHVLRLPVLRHTVLRCSALSLLCGICLLSVSAVGAQAASEAFGERVDVQLVNVEVWVTDKDGELVHGLTAEDFEIREDGEPVEISHFSEVRAPRTLPSASQRQAREQAAEVASPPAEGEVVTEAVSPPHLVIYFDFLRMGVTNRKRLIRDLRDFLAESGMPPEQIMILRQDESLDIAAPFGSSAEELAEALSKIEKADTRSAALETQLAIQRLQQLWQESQINSGFGDPCGFFTLRAGPTIDQLARSARSQNEVTLLRLAEVAGFLAGLPGVKTLLYVGDGLSTTPGAELINYAESICPAFQTSGQGFRVPEEMGESFHNLTRHANANRVTIYTLQSTGLTASFLGSASETAGDFRGRGNTTNFDTALRLNQRTGLGLLAAETGGRAAFNTNDFVEPLERMGEEMHTYYSLAYAPPHGGDGLEHRIDVRMRDRGLRARHRQGYRDKGADERMAERVAAAAFLGLTDNPLQARLGAGTVRDTPGRGYRLPLHVLVPSDRVVFLPEEGGAVARLRVQVSARDENNRRVAWQQKVFGIDQPEGDEEHLIDLAVELELPEGEFVMAVGLRDEATGESSFLATTLAIQPPEKASKKKKKGR
jgi:VWFA-related protein